MQLVVLAIDVVVCLPSSLAWVLLFGVSEPTATTVVMLLRAVTWFVALRRMLAPARAWERARRAGGDPLDVETLRAANHSLQQTPRHFWRIYACSWALALGVLFAIGMVRGMSAAQEVSALCNCVAIIFAIPTLMVPIFRSVLFETNAALVDDLWARGLSPEGPRVPLVEGLVGVFLGLVIALMLGMVSSVTWYRAEERTKLAVSEALRDVELDAQRIALTGGLDEPTAEGASMVAGVGELPPQLRALDGEETRGMAELSSERVFAAAAVGDGRWVVYEGPLDDDGWAFGLFMIIAVVLGAAPGLAAGPALNRGLTAPLTQLEASARKIAEHGRLRDQARVVTFFNDEISDVARGFNAMFDTLEELAAVASVVSEGDLRVDLEAPGDLQDAFRAMISNLGEMVVQIRGTALEVAAAAAEIQAAAQEQERAVEQQSSSVQQVGNTVASLAEAAEQINLAASNVLANAEQTRVTTDLTTARISELSALAGGIDELLSLIREVAERSDLLALNGSLEAVRAGEAGRGFALVAAEMRRLAERVTGTVADVGERVTGIQEASRGTVGATEESRQLAVSTAEAARKISTETQRQSQDTDQLAVAVYQVAEVAASTSEATSHTRATAEGLRIHAEALEGLTRQFKLRGDD
ncbi:methyl-accepting chemotaxis protein [Pseudenhygromyxa sp. WMMC2535]|uniref:methyl-accepting chemotaxis protein n=1 Tax=Pseudenhygromyxa sp. WMMC2535 TaxID=2712867 RepID=UPI001595310B|nr:HAMP domain-containing methyl-accepting chemotaxis protein [Pseudenhygromyxa sp. WMMC2535]NVB36694.1 methyl-accepting chemotaxis protein [Pseudenhygromyxa sp. WMMC2535]